MGQVDIPNTGDNPLSCQHERNRNARYDALAEFYNVLKTWFPDIYDSETAMKIVRRMCAIFAEGIRQDDAAQWKSCFMCKRLPVGGFLDLCHWDAKLGGYVLNEAPDDDAKSGVSLKGADTRSSGS